MCTFIVCVVTATPIVFSSSSTFILRPRLYDMLRTCETSKKGFLSINAITFQIHKFNFRGKYHYR